MRLELPTYGRRLIESSHRSIRGFSGQAQCKYRTVLISLPSCRKEPWGCQVGSVGKHHFPLSVYPPCWVGHAAWLHSSQAWPSVLCCLLGVCPAAYGWVVEAADKGRWDVWWKAKGEVTFERSLYNYFHSSHSSEWLGAWGQFLIKLGKLSPTSSSDTPRSLRADLAVWRQVSWSQDCWAHRHLAPRALSPLKTASPAPFRKVGEGSTSGLSLTSLEKAQYLSQDLSSEASWVPSQAYLTQNQAWVHPFLSPFIQW